MLILTNGVLEYRAAESIFQLRQTKAEVITPTESQWKAFRSSLDEIGVWNWKTTYVNPNVCDGTRWHVVLKYDAKSISTAGANVFPGGKEPNQSPPFQKLMVAVSKLLYGKEFR